MSHPTRLERMSLQEIWHRLDSIIRAGLPAPTEFSCAGRGAGGELDGWPSLLELAFADGVAFTAWADRLGAQVDRPRPYPGLYGRSACLHLRGHATLGGWVVILHADVPADGLEEPEPVDPLDAIAAHAEDATRTPAQVAA